LSTPRLPSQVLSACRPRKIKGPKLIQPGAVAGPLRRFPAEVNFGAAVAIRTYLVPVQQVTGGRFPKKAYACVEHFSSSFTGAISIFKLSITSSWALMAARCWARLILDRRRDLINDRPSRAAAAEAPLDAAQERHHFDNPTSHSRGAFYHVEAASLICFALNLCL
jgi:hypothetical protein